MTVDVVNSENKKVGTAEVSDAVFGGRVKADLIHESVVRANAAERRGTHATKTRAMVSGSGKKPWRQKGTGRARVGEIRNPLWRKGGTVFGPHPRSYAVPAAEESRERRPARGPGRQDPGRLADRRRCADRVEVKTKAAVGMLKAIGVERQGAARRRQSRREAGSVGPQRAGRGAAAEQPDHGARRGRHEDGRRHAGGAGEAGSRARLTMTSPVA